MNDEPHKDRIVDEKPQSELKVDNDEEKQGKRSIPMKIAFRHALRRYMKLSVWKVPKS